ncbi:DUF4129 domain-containing protein [Occultella glacieicola]|uniref:DUF4129 domain-containing protein n=1 Tax=Occultella glacieicola TaxID=2518684 RepID=A0ABY2E077_9MICO|nr:DUF3488 and transglutaminase-like domain-containing protein [Occultella glacieicola]TDE90810.1 DUF4129 domain-containing protein [Occultella glacieicola]
MTRRLQATIAVLVATVSSTFALVRLVDPDAWLRQGVLAILIVAAAVLCARRFLRSDVVPTLIGLVVGAFALAAMFAPRAALLGILPTRASIDELRGLVESGLVASRESTPPITGDPGVALLVVTGMLVVYLFAELLGVGAGAPAWAALPLLGLWTVPVIIGARVHTWVFVVAGLSFLMLLAIQARAHESAPRARRHETESVRRRALVAGATVVTASLLVALAAAPGLLRVPSPVRLHTLYDLSSSNSTRLDLGLDLRANLERDEDVLLVTYEGVTPAQLGPLQAYTLTTFNGSTWEREAPGETVPVQGQTLWPQDQPVGGADQSVTISIHDLGQDRLLVPGEPRTVSVEGTWAYDPVADEVIAQGSPPSPFTYDVEFTPRDLSAAVLDPLDPRTLDVDPDLLAVPDTGYGQEIADVARDVVDEAGATTPYEQALAIQNFLRDDSLFTYTQTIEGASTTDAVWDFLNDRHGYCVQFATAMAIMLRTLDIPTRVAIGFLPGEPLESGANGISAHRAHAWPQVLFPEVGWVRFEPTPSLQSGDAPAWAPTPVTGDTPSQEPTASQAPTTAAPSQAPTSDQATTTPTGTPPDSSSAQRSNVAVVLAAFAGLVVLAAAVGAWRRRRSSGGTVEHHWERALRALDRAGFDTSPTLTPRVLAHAAADRLGPEAADALARLAEAVALERYGRSDAPAADPVSIDLWAEQVVAGAKSAGPAGAVPEERTVGTPH